MPPKQKTIIPTPEKETQYHSDDEISIIENNTEEDELLNNQIASINNDIKYHIFNPEKYEIETHRELTIVPNVQRKTSDVISKYEFTDAISNRAKQIEDGGRIFVDRKDETDPAKIAEMEIRQKKCPLSVVRHISNAIIEIWAINDLQIPY